VVSKSNLSNPPGHRYAYTESGIHSKNESGNILAHGTSTMMILPGRAIVADPPLPSKFIQKGEKND
jgi:hypothetical protein